ncbi:MAG: carboxylating nicotinate-nucleotide diphosphorylase [Acidimicrobiales bacterium]
MASHHHPPIHAVRAAVTAALAEDLEPLGDLTSSLLPDGVSARAAFVTRADGVVAGTRAAAETFRQVDLAVAVSWLVDDGDQVRAGQAVGHVEGPLASMLTAERTALNFLCHLSGIATVTHRFAAEAAAAGQARVWDTRKTTPGLRTLQKAAVRAGGGWNHRGNLSDWVLLKDNHLALIGIDDAVRRARQLWPMRAVHVECDSMTKVEQALAAGADALLLDNLSPDDVRQAVKLADEHAAAGGRHPVLEASGGITLKTIGAYSAAGVDFVSTGAITISAPSLDIGLDVEPS